jgi:hypothetical protein
LRVPHERKDDEQVVGRGAPSPWRHFPSKARRIDGVRVSTKRDARDRTVSPKAMSRTEDGAFVEPAV